MKRILTLTIGTAFAALLLSGTAFAGNTHDPGINRRQHRQQQRIMRGVRSGALTPREAFRLERLQGRIRREECRMKSDGTLSRWERGKLQNDLNHASRSIYRQKHDRQHW